MFILLLSILSISFIDACQKPCSSTDTKCICMQCGDSQMCIADSTGGGLTSGVDECRTVDDCPTDPKCGDTECLNIFTNTCETGTLCTNIQNPCDARTESCAHNEICINNYCNGCTSKCFACEERPGYCINSAGECVDDQTVSCLTAFVDPCNNNPCSDSEKCLPNYCGGCGYECVSCDEMDGWCIDSHGICAETFLCASDGGGFMDPCNGNTCTEEQICQPDYCGGCNYKCVAKPTCPDIETQPGADCDYEGMTCSWGEETCCGETHASYQCTCMSGSAACLHTDACLGSTVLGCPCPDIDCVDPCVNEHGEDMCDVGVQCITQDVTGDDGCPLCPEFVRCGDPCPVVRCSNPCPDGTCADGEECIPVPVYDEFGCKGCDTYECQVPCADVLCADPCIDDNDEPKCDGVMCITNDVFSDDGCPACAEFDRCGDSCPEVDCADPCVNSGGISVCDVGNECIPTPFYDEYGCKGCDKPVCEKPITDDTSTTVEPYVSDCLPPSDIDSWIPFGWINKDGKQVCRFCRKNEEKCEFIINLLDEALGLKDCFYQYCATQIKSEVTGIECDEDSINLRSDWNDQKKCGCDMFECVDAVVGSSGVNKIGVMIGIGFVFAMLSWM
eukprot:169171_1